jgi:hypothetical protein
MLASPVPTVAGSGSAESSRTGQPSSPRGHHLYETEDSLTRHLPATHRDLIRFVELRGRKKLVVRDRLTEFSDYPHPEGLDDPVAWRHELDGVPAADVERIMSTNMFGPLGVTPPATRAA